MEGFYGEAQRRLQDQFETRRLADRVAELIVHNELEERDRAFIESRDMFFLSTVSADGWPTVSYKGGAPGFVRAIDSRTLAFPSYDGNGMYLSMGNIDQMSRIGLLFIDFETPHRLRVQATAQVSGDDPLMKAFPGAELIVRAHIEQIFVNCARYVHRYKKVAPSKYVPAEDGTAPLACWKRIDAVQSELPARDHPRVEAAGGLITMDEYEALLAEGNA